MSKTKNISKRKPKPKKRKWLKRLSLSFALVALPANVTWQFDIEDIPDPKTIIDEYYNKISKAFSDKEIPVQAQAPASTPAPKDMNIIQNGNWTHVLRGDLTEVIPFNAPPLPSGAIKWLNTRIKYMTIDYKTLTGDTQYKAVIDEWHKHLDPLKTLSKKDQIEAVNDHYNNIIEYKVDTENYNARDYFAAPQETLYNKSGDCEDYAILKYYSLKYLGFEDTDLRISVVDLIKNSTDLETAQKQSVHAVLLVDTPDGVYMLNNNKKPPNLISDNGDYQIMYSFNEAAFSKYSLYKMEDRIADRKNAQAEKQAGKETSKFPFIF